MAGHSKWHNIKHRKAAVDKKRGKAWSKCAKAIMVAAKHGGPELDSNLALRYAVDEARYANMPRDTIERAIKKGAGELGSQNFESLRYEGYGPGGAAIIIEALTDNRTRTAGDVRMVFTKFGGNLGSTGCVGFMFESRGEIIIPPAGIDPDRLMETAIEAGAQDVTEPAPGGGAEGDSPWIVTTAPIDFLRVKDALDKAGFAIADASITLVPGTAAKVSGDDAKRLLRLIDMLEDNDDIQKVHSNYDIADDELAALE